MANNLRVYVLHCQDDKYYVGKTSSKIDTTTGLPLRVVAHLNPERFKKRNGDATSSSSKPIWLEIYPPIKLVELIENCDRFDEDKYTKKYMSMYGIDNVRGGSYVMRCLSPETKKFINNEISMSEDRCFTCKVIGHFSNVCPNKYNNNRKSIECNVATGSTYYIEDDLPDVVGRSDEPKQSATHLLYPTTLSAEKLDSLQSFNDLLISLDHMSSKIDNFMARCTEKQNIPCDNDVPQTGNDCKDIVVCTD